MGAFDLRGRDLITTQEWSREELDFTLDVAKYFKAAYYAGRVEGKEYVIVWAYSEKARSWCSVQEEILIATRYGMEVVLAHPPGFELDEKIMEQARKNAEELSGSFEIVNDFESALEGAHAVFPRSWASHEAVMVGMDKFGIERERELHRKYKHWRLTMNHVDKMDKHGVMTHVLPVFRGEEADDVMDSPRSVIYDQAENRLYVQMAVLALTMGGLGGAL